jgi:hypothetical protein
LRRAKHLRAIIAIGLQHIITARMSCDVVMDVVVGRRVQRAARQQHGDQTKSVSSSIPIVATAASVAPNERAGSDRNDYKMET